MGFSAPPRSLCLTDTLYVSSLCVTELMAVAWVSAMSCCGWE